MLSAIAALIFILSPNEAAAHSSLISDSVAEVQVDEQDSEAHCHGAIECVVTLYLQTTFEYPHSDDPVSQHGTLADVGYAGIKLGREPPIPIVL